MPLLVHLLDEYEAGREFKALAFATKVSHGKSVRKVPGKLLTKPLDKITRGDFERVMDTLPPGVASVFANRMRAVMGFAVSRDYLDTNPASGIESPKSGEYRPWTPAEYAKFLTCADLQLRMAVVLGYWTGQRLSDVLKIKWSDVQGDSIYVRQQKTGVELSVPVHPELLRELKAHPKTGAYVICMTHGGGEDRYTEQTMRTKFTRERKRLGLPKDLCFHGLRKAMAVMLAESGASTREIMAMGGWKTSRQVDHYTKGANQATLARMAMERLRGRGVQGVAA